MRYNELISLLHAQKLWASNSRKRFAQNLPILADQL